MISVDRAIRSRVQKTSAHRTAIQMRALTSPTLEEARWLQAAYRQPVSGASPSLEAR